MLFNERQHLTSFIWCAFPGLGLVRQPHSQHTNRYSVLGLSFHRINLLDSRHPSLIDAYTGVKQSMRTSASHFTTPIMLYKFHAPEYHLK